MCSAVVELYGVERVDSVVIDSGIAPSVVYSSVKTEVEVMASALCVITEPVEDELAIFFCEFLADAFEVALLWAPFVLTLSCLKRILDEPEALSAKDFPAEVQITSR